VGGCDIGEHETLLRQMLPMSQPPLSVRRGCDIESVGFDMREHKTLLRLFMPMSQPPCLSEGGSDIAKFL
jgi:hypothetical protein